MFENSIKIERIFRIFDAVLRKSLDKPGANKTVIQSENIKIITERIVNITILKRMTHAVISLKRYGSLLYSAINGMNVFFWAFINNKLR